MNLDRPYFTIICRTRTGEFYAAERGGHALTSRIHVVRDIITGQVSDVQAVLVSNPVEHTCDDITDDIAMECARMLCAQDAVHLIRPSLRDWIDFHAPGALPIHKFEPAREHA